MLVITNNLDNVHGDKQVDWCEAVDYPLYTNNYMPKQ